MPFDPENPTFYGESLPVEIGRDITGTAIATKATGLTEGAAVTWLYDDDYVQVADAGDAILFGVYPQWTYLQPDSDVVFSVVVELAAGSSGTFRLSAGSDPAWDLTSEALCTEALGTFTAAPGRVTAPVATSWTAPMIYAGDVEPLIFLEVLTGTVVIRQIRVRMWPPSGASGAWASDPAYELESEPGYAQSGGRLEVNAAAETPQAYKTGGPQAYVQGPGLWGGFDDYGDTEAAFDAMIAALAAEPFPTYQAFDFGTHYDGLLAGQFAYYWTLRSLGTPGRDWKGGYNLGMVLLMFRPQRRTFRQAGLNYNDPDRIPWEDSAAVRDGVTGGTLRSDFGGWTAYPTITAPGVNGEHVGVRVFGLDEPEWDQQGSEIIAGRFYNFYYDSSGISTGPVLVPPAAGEVALPDSPVVAVEIAPTFKLSPPDTFEGLTFESAIGIGDHAIGSRTLEYRSTRVRHVVDNVQYFDPALAPAPERVPRFFVRDLDGVDRPVGDGKPATETAVFVVPTPMGLYRDLTFEEYSALPPA